MHDSGIYKITIGEKYYYGLSSALRCRERNHLRALERGAHKNPKMQAAYNKYQAFKFEPVVFCAGEYMYRLEGELIRANIGDKKCMNLYADTQEMRVMTEETRRRYSEARVGKVFSPEHRQKISAANTGRVRTQEQRRRYSAALKGRVFSEQHRKRISEAFKGNERPNRPLVMFGPSGEEFYFRSVKAASEYFKCDRGKLGGCLSGRCEWPRIRRSDSKIFGWRGHYLSKEEV